MTQTNSRTRVKHDGIGEDRMKFIYESFQSMPVEEFRQMCLQAIDDSTGKKDTKNTFTDIIRQANSKATMLTKLTNYFLAGEGKRV